MNPLRRARLKNCTSSKGHPGPGRSRGTGELEKAASRGETPEHLKRVGKLMEHPGPFLLLVQLRPFAKITPMIKTKIAKFATGEILESPGLKLRD